MNFDRSNKTRTSSCQRVTVKVSVPRCWEIVAIAVAGDIDRGSAVAGAVLTKSIILQGITWTPRHTQSTQTNIKWPQQHILVSSGR